jgi:hypothetical protein
VKLSNSLEKVIECKIEKIFLKKINLLLTQNHASLFSDFDTFLFAENAAYLLSGNKYKRDIAKNLGIKDVL